MRLSIVIFIYGLLGSLLASAQVSVNTPDTSHNDKKIIKILDARIIHFIKQDSTHNYYTAAGNVVMKQEKTLFYADSVAVNLFDNSLEAFGNIHINDADSVHTYAQYLKYIGNTKKAQLRKKVRLTDGSGTLTTEELDYEVNQKIGVYRNGGKLVNKKTTLTSEQANYYGDTREVIFTRKVVLVDPEYTIRTDTLQYNTQTESIRLSSPTRIVDSSKRIILTRNAYFDRKNKKGFLYERSQIIDTAYTFTADDMALDDSTGRGEFRGNAVYRSKDSTEGFDLIANNIKVDRKKDILLATVQPLLLIKQKRDTTFVAADTLYVARLIDLRKTREVPVIRDKKLKDTLTAKKKVAVADSTAKYFEAYAHVKVYTDSLQGVGDSLFYASDDSAFRFFKSPVIWAKENQIVGDTIYLFLKNKKPEMLSVFENALAINKIDSTPYFNQLRGTRMQALFEDGEMYFMSAKGSAENVYYFQDEQKHFISVNKSTCDVINIYLENNKPQKVSFLNKYEGTAYPMRKADHESLKLRKFKWLDSIRPKSKADLLQYAPVVIPLAEKIASNDKPNKN